MSDEITIAEILNLALKEELERDNKVFIIGEEVANGGAYKVTKNLKAIFGEDRIVNTPICEYGFTGLSIGAAFGGLKPVVDFMTMNFSLQAIDHIINSSAKSLYMSGGLKKNSIVFRGPNGFAYGVGAQHTHDLSVMYGSVPGLKVVAPFSAEDHKGCLKKAIRDPNPVVFLENEVLYTEKFNFTETLADKNYLQEFKAVIENTGDDITLVGVSISVKICLEVSEMLKKENISAEVINLVSIRPLDVECVLKSVEKTKRLVIVDFNWKTFSVASEISACVNEKLFRVLKSPVQRICAKEIPTPYAKNLEELMYPTKEKVFQKILRSMFN